MLVVVPVVLGLVLLGIWAARRPLSEAAVQRWFAGQQVDARYRITALSPSEVTLEDVALGPVAKPDFTAERIVARVGWSPLRPRIGSVTLVRPQLRMAISGKGVSLGSLDRLLPKSDTPQPLPDIDVRLIDGRIVAATPLGLLTGRGDGAGRLRDGFAGVLRVDPARFAARGCVAEAGGTTLRIVTARDRMTVAGSGNIPQLACGAAMGEALAWRGAATLPPTMDRYRVTFAIDAARLRVPGYRAASARVSGTAAAPSLSAAVVGDFAAVVDTVAGQVAARRAAARGRYRVDPLSGAASVGADLTLTGASVAPPLAILRDTARRAAGTFAAPLVTRLADRLAAAARNFGATARIDLVRDGEVLTGGIRDLEMRTASGARLRQAGRIDLRDGGAVGLAGGLNLSGGGLPSAAITGNAVVRDGRLTGRGSAALAQWTVPGASIAAPRLDFRADDGGVLIDGRVLVSGGLGGGVVATALAVPLAARIGVDGSVAVTRCTAVEWAGLARGTVRLAPARLRLCPSALAYRGGRLSGGGVFDALALRGTADGTDFAVASAPLRLTLTGDIAHLAPARLDLSSGARRVSAVVSGSVDIVRLAGSGRIASASYVDPASPVNLDRADAGWTLARGRLSVSGGNVRVTDRTAPARFEPIRLANIVATIVDGRIAARGEARLASSGARLLGFTARHDIASARGAADLDTGTLVFGPMLQPYQITERLRGIVDNVRGPVVGTGHVDWVGTALTSRGRLRIDKLALATAALGPVDGIDGGIEFNDLLTLTTPPGQRLRIARINPGVAVDDGVAVFRMLAPDAAAIESIVWPYAGGTLTLAPVTIRAGDLRRDFRLTVDNLDAEAFLQRFEIKNLNVTGRFDGVLPLVFEGNGGRIVAGRLVARKGGGLVQYVGEVGAKEMGAGAKLAFDALRRLRYRDLALDLDGDLDGELVTQLRFAGTNEAATTLGGGPLPIRATGLPFNFNVTVRAPFRALLGTAASFSDVRPLIRPAAEQVQPR